MYITEKIREELTEQRNKMSALGLSLSLSLSLSPPLCLSQLAHARACMPCIRASVHADGRTGGRAGGRAHTHTYVGTQAGRTARRRSPTPRAHTTSSITFFRLTSSVSLNRSSVCVRPCACACACACATACATACVTACVRVRARA